MNIYSAFASKLSWGEYYRLLKKLLFKLDKAKMRAKSVSAQGEPELEKEKIITKSICKVLEGFNFKEVPDAIEKLIEENKVYRETKSTDAKLWGSNLSDLLKTKEVEEII